MKNNLIFSIIILCSSFIYTQTVLIPAPTLEKGWERIKIEFLGTIDLPPNMEIQGGNYKQYMDNLKEINGAAASKVIIKQKNLNNLTQSSLNTYARVFIRSEIGTFGEFKKLKSSSFSQTELTQMNNTYKSELQLELSKNNAKILEWYQAKQTTVNGIICITMGYKRQIGTNPPVNITFYFFHNYDRMHILIFEYRISDAQMWTDTFDKILKSYHITNIK
jgi:hypothetical protein